MVCPSRPQTSSPSARSSRQVSNHWTPCLVVVWRWDSPTSQSDLCHITLNSDIKIQLVFKVHISDSRIEYNNCDNSYIIVKSLNNEVKWRSALTGLPMQIGLEDPALLECRGKDVTEIASSSKQFLFTFDSNKAFIILFRFFE